VEAWRLFHDVWFRISRCSCILIIIYEYYNFYKLYIFYTILWFYKYYIFLNCLILLWNRLMLTLT
jgi:hypothetical protein